MNNSKHEYSYRIRVYESYISKRLSHDTAYHARSYLRWAEAVERRFAGWLPKDPKVPILDIGCGHGNCLYLLERKGYSDLTGVDLGAEQLELAAQHAPTANLVQDDLMNFLTKHSNQYGLIVCLNVIEHFNKQEIFQFLDLLVDALKPGGRVIFETPNADSPWFGTVAYADLTHEWFFTPRGLADTVALVNLEGFEARPSDPVPSGGKGWIRYLVWQFVRRCLSIWNLAETGSVGSGIYTRVFVATATKKLE